MNYERCDVSFMWTLQWSSIGGGGFYWVRNQTNANWNPQGWNTGSLQFGGYDCYTNVNSVNSLKRGVIKLTTTLENPTAGYFDLTCTSNHGVGDFASHSVALVGTIFTSDSQVWPVSSYDLDNFLTGSVLSNEVNFNELTPGYGTNNYRFYLNQAGLDFFATAGTKYLGILHVSDIDSASFEWLSNQNNYMNIGYSYPYSNEPSVHPKLHLFSDIQELSTLVPTSCTRSCWEEDGQVESTGVYSWHTAGSNFGVQAQYVIEGGSPTTIAFWRYDLSQHTGKTCVYARIGVMSYPDTTPPSVLRWQAGIVRKQLDFDTLDYNYYSASLPWTDFLTGDADGLSPLLDYDDGLGTLYYRCVRYVEATGSHSWLTYINNVLDGTDQYPANKLTFCFSTSGSVADELGIYNGVHSTDAYAGPFLTLGFSSSEAPAGVEYVTVGIGSVVGMESMTW